MVWAPASTNPFATESCGKSSTLARPGATRKTATFAGFSNWTVRCSGLRSPFVAATFGPNSLYWPKWAGPVVAHAASTATHAREHFLPTRTNSSRSIRELDPRRRSHPAEHAWCSLGFALDAASKSAQATPGPAATSIAGHTRDAISQSNLSRAPETANPPRKSQGGFAVRLETGISCAVIVAVFRSGPHLQLLTRTRGCPSTNWGSQRTDEDVARRVRRSTSCRRSSSDRSRSSCR